MLSVEFRRFSTDLFVLTYRNRLGETIRFRSQLATFIVLQSLSISVIVSNGKLKFGTNVYNNHADKVVK